MQAPIRWVKDPDRTHRLPGPELTLEGLSAFYGTPLQVHKVKRQPERLNQILRRGKWSRQ